MVMFYESYYLANNADVAKAVKAGYFNSGWEHYVAHGWLENRSFTAPAGYGAFNENYYLANNPDVAFAVQEGYFATGWQHYVIHGQAEGRSSAMPAGYNDFNETYYLTNNPDVAEAVEDGIFLSGWHHYSWTGRLEGRTYAQPVGYGNFSEYYYLINNPDVAAAVDADYFTSGWQHYVVHGQSEGRSFAAPTFTIGATTIQNGGEMPTLAPIVTPNLYTLQDVYVAGTEGTPPVKEVYWGYTPCTDCQDPEGIPVSELLDFVATITGLDLTELGLIDDDGVGPFDNVTSLSLSMGNISNENETETGDIDGDGVIDPDSTLTITFADGTSVNAEAFLGENYMQFLRDLIFYEDKDGILHSRLFEKVVEEGTSGDLAYYEPLVLTPTQNNGSTVENPFYHLTTSGDDRIVAGRLELLHGAYIDGGGGNNTLEIDAKGVYAQPLALVNIQHVLIENLPNIYTTNTPGTGPSENVSGTGIIDDDYPYFNDTTKYFKNSIIDISRAVDIETLTITEGRFDGFTNNGQPGSLTVAGIRNGVTTTLDGGFSQNVYLHYSAVSDDAGINLVLRNLNMMDGTETGAQLVVAHNSDTLNIESAGGGNWLHNGDLGGRLSKMVITGDAHLYIQHDLDPSFHDASPVIIDASANTGGVTLTLSGSQNVTFLGSTADDNFVVSTADTEVMAENDETVTIVDMAGNNRYEVSSYSVSITDGNGNNNYEVDAHDATVVAGNGNNHFEVSTTELANLTAGNGNNHFEVSTSKLASLTAGDGDNHFEVTAESLTLTAGNGDNVVESKGGESAAIVLGSGDNSINTDGKDSVNIAVGGGDNSISSIGSAAVAVVTGNGDNTIIASAESLDIATGTGNDVVTIAGTANSSEEIGNGPDGRTGLNLMLILDDSGSMSGPEIESLKAAANSLFDNIEEQNMEAVAITVVFGTNASASPWGSIDDARTLIDALQGTSGGTDYVAALNVAMEGFAQTGAISGGVNVSIFISDGFPNEPISTSLQSTWEGFLIQNDMVSHALGIGALNDLEPLRPIAYNGYTGQDLDPIIGSLDEGILEDLVGEAVVSVSGKDALVNIDLGSGQNTLILGDSDELSQGLIAVEGSSITGESIKLIVNTVSDLRAAELQGITKVVLDNDDIGTSNRTVENGLLTLTAEQFTAIGAANFSVEGSIFHTYSQVKIIVTESTSLTALGVDSLSRNIDLLLELEDGVTLAMTAEQLHTKVAPNGITLADDGTTDVVSGKVVITGGGVNFDPFNTSDTVRTIIDGREYVGGSLSTDFMVDGEWYNVTVESGTSYDPQGNEIPGYDRPADAPALVVFKINTGTGANTVNDDGVDTWHTGLEIVGERDINFTGPIQLGEVNNVSTNAFTIDFSELEGNVTNMVIDHFEQLGQGGGIHGNADKGYTAEVLINLAADEGITGTAAAGATNSIGFDETDAQGLVSSGVSKYVVTVIDGPTASANLGNQATIKLCDTTQDLEVLALRGNFNDTLKVVDAAWGLAFELQGGSTLKADGPTGTANVGKLLANYQWDGADAVVSLTHSVVGDTRTIKAYGITINNANSISIDVAGSAMIESVAGNSVEVLDVDATGNVTFVADLPDALEAIDAAGVLGTFSAVIDYDGSGDFSFVGAAGGTSLTILDFVAGDETVIDGGVGGVVITVGQDGGTDIVDLSAATLINVDGFLLQNGTKLGLTLTQLTAIGAGNINLAAGAAGAFLDLYDLDGEPFALADFASGIAVDVLNMAKLPVITLHPDTDLTGIGQLNVHEGTVLNMTAAQFQQLNGAGTIVGIAGTTDFTVNITDLTQADVEDGIDLSGIAADTVTLALAESVTLADSDNLGAVSIITFGDDMTLGLGEIQQANGLSIIGGANSTLLFTDTFALAFESIDASGFDVTTLKILNVLVAQRNVDLMFLGLSQSIIKLIYSDLGWVDGQNQYVVLEEGTTIPGWVVFNKPEADAEIRHFYLTMSGGTEISGNLRLSASDQEEDLLQTDLRTVTITSEGTAENLITGNTANIITGQLTSQGTGLQGSYTSVDNDLLNVVINATQDLEIRGGIVFESVVGNDSVTANDDDAAVATLTVNRTADVSLGVLDTSDDDVDALNVINNGTGTLSVVINGALVDADDALSFTGTGSIVLTTVGSVNLSDDDLTAVTAIKVADSVPAGVLTLSYDQLVAIGAANISVIDGADPSTTIEPATLHIVGYTGGAFNATALDANFTTVTITTVAGTITLDPGVNLTGVDAIYVPEGSTLTMTAAQFQQLQGFGTIEAIDANDDSIVDPITVNITGLTQADVAFDANGDGDYVDAGDYNLNFNNVDVAGGTIKVTLGEADVTLGVFNSLGALLAGTASVLNGAEFELADNQTLRLVNATQANGLDVYGGTNTTLVFMFDSMPAFPFQIDASGYSITTLKALATFVDGTNIEYNIDDLPSSVELRIFHDPLELGWLNATYRVVFVEESVTIPGQLFFNDWDPTDEVYKLTITMDGGVLVQGNLNLPTRTDKDGNLVQRFFDTLTINSQGTAANLGTGNTNNVIDGTILTAFAVPVPPNTFNNNLLKVVINASQNFVLTGDIIFSSVDATDYPAASLTVTGTANVTMDQINVSDPDISILNIANTGTGTLTVTGSSPAIFDNLAGGVGDAAANLEVLNFSGTGNIVIGFNPAVATEWGITAQNLSLIDAFALTGNLDLGEIRGIDSKDFQFISGSGLTKVILTTDALTSDTDGADNILGTADDEPGWRFDFSAAAAGSEFHLGAGLGFTTPGSILDINLGAKTTLYIDTSLDLSLLNLTINQSLPIVLADGAILTLTAAQASGLTIIAGPDTGAPGITAQVNIVDLGAYTDLNSNGNNDDPAELVPYDFSGIAANIAGVATLFDNDVTLHQNTNLGFFTIQLDTLFDNDVNNLSGQTIRFATVAQAERAIVVVGDDNDGSPNSTNVVWLFNSITAPVETKDYDIGIGRLWMSAALINNMGGDVEQLFTTLPLSILRVDFATLTELNILLNSLAVDRVIELVAFTQLNNVTFSDNWPTPEEHIRTLTINMGGNVVVGDLFLGDINAGATINPLSISFNGLTINSSRALHQDHILAPEHYVNDNDGTDEAGEHQLPSNLNTIGNIGIGTLLNGIDLMSVTLNTGALSTPGGGLAGSQGADLSIQTITFDREPGAGSPTASLVVTGANHVTIKSLNTADPDITGLNVNLFLHTGVYTVTGGSPAAALNATEVLTIVTGAGSQAYFGHTWTDADNDGNVDAGEMVLTLGAGGVPYAGVAGADLSEINVSGTGYVNLGVLASIDSSNDDSTPETPANDGLIPAFVLNGNNGGGGGNTVAILGRAIVGGTPSVPVYGAPILNADSEWIFRDVNLTITEDVVFQAGADLTLDGVALTIEGAVDLSMVDLTLAATVNPMTIWVPAGQTLTIDVAQMAAMYGFFAVYGEGTTVLVGDGTDLLAASFGAIRTVNVDMSAITLLPADADGQLVAVFATSALLDDGTTLGGRNVIGSANDDRVTMYDTDDTFRGGPGNDTHDIWPGNDTHLVDAGTDTILGLASDGPGAGEDDVLVVSAGATADAAVLAPFAVSVPSTVLDGTGTALINSTHGFIATAETINNGTANLTGGADDATLIDVSLAGGANGFNLVGGTGNATGLDVLIGSNQADRLNGGNNNQSAGAARDILTGNGGADVFVFDVLLSTAASLIVETTQAGIDYELITITPDAVDNGDEGMTVSYTLNGVLGSVAVNLAAVDVTEAQAVALAVAQALNGAAGLAASATAGVVTMSGLNAASLTISGVSTSGTVDALAGAISDGPDQAQIVTVTVDGTVTPGDYYSLLATLVLGGGEFAAFTAVGTTTDSVATGLEADFTDQAGVITASVAGSVVTITDGNPNNGGFTVQTSTRSAFVGSGASNNGATHLITADVITDFTTNVDKIAFGLAAGTAANYAEAAAAADYATALINANAAFNGTVQYYLTSVLDQNVMDTAPGTGSDALGLLFFDANLDGTVDGVVALIGVDASNFTHTDIIAA